jgi:Protein of unknown function (DUF4231)
LRFAIPRVSFNRTGRNARVKELQERIAEMKAALSPLLTDKAKEAYWSEWEYHVVDSASSVETDKKAYYSLRTIALISSITVPSLVGLNLSGTGGDVVRWLTFAFGLVTAITTGMLTLYRLNDRWLMYRELNQDLIKIGWTLVESSDTDPQKAWESFTKATDKAMTDYNNTYVHAVIQTTISATSDRGPGRAPTDDHA